MPAQNFDERGGVPHWTIIGQIPCAFHVFAHKTVDIHGLQIGACANKSGTEHVIAIVADIAAWLIMVERLLPEGERDVIRLIAKRKGDQMIFFIMRGSQKRFALYRVKYEVSIQSGVGFQIPLIYAGLRNRKES